MPEQNKDKHDHGHHYSTPEPEYEEGTQIDGYNMYGKYSVDDIKAKWHEDGTILNWLRETFNIPDSSEEETEKFIDQIIKENFSPNDPCEPIKDAASCDANSLCTWCTNHAVPSECWLITDAKSLPPGVYNCDKLEEPTSEPIPVEEYVKITEETPEPESDTAVAKITEEESEIIKSDPCEPIKDAASCDANSLCTWCTNHAVPSECWLITDAKSLPPGVYNCDKLEEDE